ncbi:anti-sigma factor [Actinomadura graeca]|uniref:Regulator of SigK n=1 Tax=Actinomadura graeca TaxID=2750812 RepID=A0ABX8R0F7_9ACTN|nr:anti-sigma factor [Actinomadura graeca]QXJ24554.1 anti-sigma factor [Actinomadura graeca]
MSHASPTVHALSGAYALDGLSEDERRRFEDHLGRCGDCALEVRGLQETAARLGAAAAVSAPPRMRSRVLVEVARTRQVAPHQAMPRPEPRPHRRTGRVLPRLLTVAAAACLAVAVALGVLAQRADERADRLQARQELVASVLTAPDARAVTGHVRRGGQGTVVVSRRLDKAVVVLAGLPSVSAARTYELWLLGDGAPRPAGLTEGASGPVLLDGIGAATQVGLTIEPAAGSAAPTTPPIFAAALPA